MLVLTRKEGERLVITDENSQLRIEIFVSEIRQGRVRIGFEAPTHLRIVREELLLSQESQKTARSETPLQETPALQTA